MQTKFGIPRAITSRKMLEENIKQTSPTLTDAGRPDKFLHHQIIDTKIKKRRHTEWDIFIFHTTN